MEACEKCNRARWECDDPVFIERCGVLVIDEKEIV
jgi:hypothetical protein